MFTNLIRWTGVLLFAAQTSIAMAQDGPVMVTVDRAKIFRIDDGASAVIVGNPFIADVSMFDENTVVITGKSYGTTNLVILDSNSKPIVDEVITVRASEDDVVAVYRKSLRSTMSCNPSCEPTMRLGDDVNAFNGIAEQANSRNSMAASAAGVK
ncbi:MAG: pilus assembly protein N-terminal domain-containing protein [Roseibium album]|uniref:pilus assembly protein N-terminal domain-containing protein n=1 Tax=Roseibium album TaxID=311410 RepID=UPI000CF15361|nr:pilus assembly protein N-terminal domain-containing protein [Roseibium album]MBG6145860.1 Flp pilus assembly secretin CpaC [Labrenzia sp. EL_142]MBG6154707.1 Flp pilus assembly secretin CpaC [Labrenzia sp. EL_162]MBG6161986.1 Flp pilus assembly secretin CpaC [Labrenzia sp. EL_195]MBG6176258.1 Flp pilus assembly secretin CpaC [Labrenzia sp. EL_132]MBG6193163.1 Flp pilus assembly secretin CpaC [Labrenzia sp. EL_159]MBG6199527.1 Flp pilus assembly secretin CpaC [Labrenzia sp. EL_13]MBG621130